MYTYERNNKNNKYYTFEGFQPLLNQDIKNVPF